jgi:hypothetical protein
MCAYAQLLIVRTLGQLLIDAERCRRMPDSRHAQHMQTHFQLSICSNACSKLSALNVCRHMLKYVLLSKRANASGYTISS